MEAQVWTLIAVVIATLVGSSFYLGQRIDNLSVRIEEQGRVFLGHISDLKIKAERHDVRFEQIDGRFDRLEAQGEALAQQIYGVATALNDHVRRHAG